MIDWHMLGEVFLQTITLTFMLIGLIGLLIPIFPGIIIIWLSALVYALFQYAWGGMTGWDWFIFALICILMIIGSVIDNIIITNKLRETGTPWKSIALGYGAGIISGLFLTPLVALVITPLALYLAEYQRLRDKAQAFQSLKSWLVGFSWSVAALMLVGSLMIGFWLAWIVY